MCLLRLRRGPGDPFKSDTRLIFSVFSFQVLCARDLWMLTTHSRNHYTVTSCYNTQTWIPGPARDVSSCAWDGLNFCPISGMLWDGVHVVIPVWLQSPVSLVSGLMMSGTCPGPSSSQTFRIGRQNPSDAKRMRDFDGVTMWPGVRCLQRLKSAWRCVTVVTWRRDTEAQTGRHCDKTRDTLSALSRPRILPLPGD